MHALILHASFAMHGLVYAITANVVYLHLFVPPLVQCYLSKKGGGFIFEGGPVFGRLMVYHTAGINCVDLNDPMNGEVTFNTTLNSQAHYSCNDGYCLSGNRYRTCQCGGNWTGTEPTCGPGKQY